MESEHKSRNTGFIITLALLPYELSWACACVLVKGTIISTSTSVQTRITHAGGYLNCEQRLEMSCNIQLTFLENSPKKARALIG